MQAAVLADAHIGTDTDTDAVCEVQARADLGERVELGTRDADAPRAQDEPEWQQAALRQPVRDAIDDDDPHVRAEHELDYGSRPEAGVGVELEVLVRRDLDVGTDQLAQRQLVARSLTRTRCAHTNVSFHSKGSMSRSTRRRRLRGRWSMYSRP